MGNFSYRFYTNNEVVNIIRKALKNKPKNSISHQELIKTAKEFGLNENDVEHAIFEEEKLQDNEQLKLKWMEKEKADFKSHFSTFVIMIIVFFFINVFTGRAWWFQWPLLGWGIGMAFHFKGAYFPTEEEIEKGINKLKKKKGIAV
jgi:hypothetical protein